MPAGTKTPSTHDAMKLRHEWGTPFSCWEKSVSRIGFISLILTLDGESAAVIAFRHTGP